jgi:hypothetical protein
VLAICGQWVVNGRCNAALKFLLKKKKKESVFFFNLSFMPGLKVQNVSKFRKENDYVCMYE